MVKRTPKQAIFAILLLLQGCLGGENYAPIIERKERARVVPKVHIVKRGDTLYSIAWRYNLEVSKLANANGVDSSYLIYPGQKIALKYTGARNSKRVSSTRSSAKKAAGKSKRQVTNSGKFAKDNTPVKNTVQTTNSASPMRWRWPVRGKLVRRFGGAGGLHKGIDIKGKLGEPVHAASDAKVVYAGSGLVGYGKLLILKHNEQYLSAYGHNSRLLVAEGQLVKAGQLIAEIGDTGTDEVKLHFEIRRNGKPVDPLKLLPRGK